MTPSPSGWRARSRPSPSSLGMTEIGQDDVRAEVGDLPERVLAVDGRLDGVAPAGQQLLKPDARRRVVFDDEDANVVVRSGGFFGHGGLPHYLPLLDSRPAVIHSAAAMP